MAPAATPEPIVERFQTEVLAVLADSGVKQKLLAQGLEAHGTTGPDFGKYIDAQADKWGKVIREANIKAE